MAYFDIYNGMPTSTLKKTCSVTGCDNPVRGRGLCSTCYARKKRHKDFVPGTQTERFKHRLINIDEENKKATCLVCGEVKIFRRGVNSKNWRCAVASNANKRKRDRIKRKTRNVVLLDHCEICGTKDNLCWDHDHVTNLFRGTLCGYCNTAIGLFKDDPDQCINAANYLKPNKNDVKNLLSVKYPSIDQICSVTGCGEKSCANGMCVACYYLYLRYGNATAVPPPKKWKHRITNVDEVNKRGICSNCGDVKIVRHGANSKNWRCSIVANERSKDYKRAYRRKKKSKLLDACEICGSKENLCWDHNHITGNFRGTLCKNCNMAIGLLQDNPKLCVNASKYLKKKY